MTPATAPILLVLISLVYVVLKLHSLDDPFDSDAGAHFYLAHHRNRTGKNLLPMMSGGKPPGMYLINVLIDAVLPGAVAYRCVLICVHICVAGCVYAIATATQSQLTGLIAFALYLAITAAPESRTHFSVAETWVNLFGTMAVLAAVSGWHWAYGAGLLALALCCKQTAVFYLPVLWYLMPAEGGLILFFSVSAFIVVMRVFKDQKTLPKSVFPWKYIINHWKRSIYDDLFMIRVEFRCIWREIGFLVILAVLSVFSGNFDKMTTIWLIMMVLAAVVQRHYAVHHFMPCIAPVSVLAAAYIVGNGSTLLYVLLLLLFLRLAYRSLRFMWIDPRRKMEELWGTFGVMMVAGKEIGEFFRKSTTYLDNVLQVGDQTSLYYYAHRQAPWHKMHWIYPEPPCNLNEQLANCINHRKPKYIVFMTPLTRKYTDMKQLQLLLKINYELDRVYYKVFPVYRRKMR